MNKVLQLESIKDTNLYRALEDRNNAYSKSLIGNLPTLCEEAADKLKLAPYFFKEYTLHDKTHLLRVTEIMSFIIGEGISNFNDVEIAILILSAFYHDIGMVINDNDYQALEKAEDFILFKNNWILDHPNYNEIKVRAQSITLSIKERDRLTDQIKELETAILTDYLRNTHGQRSHDYITALRNDKRFEIFGINLIPYIAKICLSHIKSVDWISSENGFNYDESIGTLTVNTVYLALVLRLADILDFDSDRTPDILFKSIHFTNEISMREWQKHRSVKGWNIGKENIRYSMYFEQPVYEKTARIFLDWIDEELINAHCIVKKTPASFNKHQILLPEKVDRSRIGPIDGAYIYHDLEFNLSRDEIIKLLMTDKLYGDESLFIRELLQNSLDALRLRKAIYKMDGFEWNDGCIKLIHYVDENNQEIVECIDNGCGMDEDIINKFLGKVGRSYYRSPEYERQRVKLREKNVDFDPCAQFGIGFMSCFMIGDRIEILTKKDYGHQKGLGIPLIVTINGLGGLISIKKGQEDQPVGTRVKIYARKSPFFYDEWSDKIKLIKILKGYALATEFPITGLCKIEGINGEINIPVDIDVKKSFLETFAIENLKVSKVDFSSVNNNLRGYLKQCFLTDENGMPTLENSEAEWLIEKDENSKNNEYKLILNLKKYGNKVEYNSMFNNSASTCIDGILVAGDYGRFEFHEELAHKLNWYRSPLHSEHAFTIDIRGNIKPELTPARLPIEHSGMNLPFGWRIIQKLINRTSGILWGDILKMSNQKTNPEIFWILMIIYGGDTFNITSQLLYQNLQIPLNDTNWLKILDIKSFTIQDEKTSVVINNGNKRYINFPESIISWDKIHNNKTDYNKLIQNLLIKLSEFDPKNNEFVIKQVFNQDECPSDASYYWKTVLPFKNVDFSYIASKNYDYIFNRNNPLLLEWINGYYSRNKTEIQEFANQIINLIEGLIKGSIKTNSSNSIDIKNRQLKFVRFLYKSIDWSKYKNEYKPPYKIFINKQTSLEITEEMINSWN